MSTYPDIDDYAFISDCRSAALVSRDASIDWCCLPRMDHASCFGRLLDWRHGGFFAIRPEGSHSRSRRYIDDTLVLETTFRSGGGEALLLDVLPVADGRAGESSRLVRIVEGIRGHVDFTLDFAPRFDYGELPPWRRYLEEGVYSFIGGDDGLVLTSEADVSPVGEHDLHSSFSVRARERRRFCLSFIAPHQIDGELTTAPLPGDLDDAVDHTLEWWRRWASDLRLEGEFAPGCLRSALVLKGLAHPTTGAIVAAPTTSLPESPGGSLNWDYRYSWIRDSAFSVRSLAQIGFTAEADAFRRFIERSTAGSGDRVQVMYGVGGERRLNETVAHGLEGYRGARPVRIGNAASTQLQLDVYGELAELAWRWHSRGNSPDDDYWRFLLELIGFAADNWKQPDRGIWEIRGEPQHFVHSKAMCWAALDRGVKLADESLRRAPTRRWRRERDALRAAIEREGYDAQRGVFTQAFGSDALDAAVLLLPAIGFVEWTDDRMVRTVDAVREELDADGLLYRYRVERGTPEREGAFLACSFWLAECLARQGRVPEARHAFDRTVASGNDLGLLAEEFHPGESEMLGNFPQGLTHLSHISAAIALAGAMSVVSA